MRDRGPPGMHCALSWLLYQQRAGSPSGHNPSGPLREMRGYNPSGPLRGMRGYNPSEPLSLLDWSFCSRCNDKNFLDGFGIWSCSNDKNSDNFREGRIRARQVESYLRIVNGTGT
ncbi:hypothetical protein DFH28DRAFT_928013 [Melampsora americana]|nr:hypothetical protein DFH28DRAFT_928013 [Melampsora americana]